MTKNNLEELRMTLENLRRESHPDIPAEVIKEIVDVQHAFQDNPTKRQSETRKIILRYANMIEAKEGDQQ